jgi:hypothetical protein
MQRFWGGVSGKCHRNVSRDIPEVGDLEYFAFMSKCISILKETF